MTPGQGLDELVAKIRAHPGTWFGDLGAKHLVARFGGGDDTGPWRRDGNGELGGT